MTTDSIPENGDEPLLAVSTKQWHLGDWPSLAALNEARLREHPERASLALLAATGRLQLGDSSGARRLIELASEWGASKHLVAQLLVGGVHNSLGRAASVLKQQDRANRHFLSAVKSVLPDSDASHVSQLRQSTQGQLRALSHDLDLLNFLDGSEDNTLFVDCKVGAPSATSADIGGRRLEQKSIRLGCETRPFFFRPESKGDLGVIKQVFEQNQYAFDWIPQGIKVEQLFASLHAAGKRPAIVDGGGNIGASCVWFAHTYPGSSILTVEPDEDNCKLLSLNAATLDVQVFAGALSNSRRILYFQDPDQSDWAFRVGETGTRPVRCIGPEDLLRECESRDMTPVILKLDIEGGEEYVFEGDCEWMKNFAVVIVELHDWLFPEGNTSVNFLNAIARHKFQVYTRGENLFCFNKQMLERTI